MGGFRGLVVIQLWCSVIQVSSLAVFLQFYRLGLSCNRCVLHAGALHGGATSPTQKIPARAKSPRASARTLGPSFDQHTFPKVRRT